MSIRPDKCKEKSRDRGVQKGRFQRKTALDYGERGETREGKPSWRQKGSIGKGKG
jgi:hypothetical protein